MPKINSRAKGASAEREVIKILQSVVDRALGKDAFKLERNLEQTRNGGCDIVGAPKEFDFFSFEIKRQEKLQISKWMQQCIKQSRDDQIPVLIYRQARRPWRVVVSHRLNLFKVPQSRDDFISDYLVEFDLAAFCDMYYALLMDINKYGTEQLFSLLYN